MVELTESFLTPQDSETSLYLSAKSSSSHFLPKFDDSEDEEPFSYFQSSLNACSKFLTVEPEEELSLKYSQGSNMQEGNIALRNCCRDQVVFYVWSKANIELRPA